MQTEKHLEEEKAKIEAEGQTLAPSLYFTKQGALTSNHVLFIPSCELCERLNDFPSTRLNSPPLCFTLAVIGNACGTIGILHSVANNSTLAGGVVELGKTFLCCLGN